jgi:hypothetical protein
MQGYIVEVDPEIERTTSTVMNGAKWSVWRPQLLRRTIALIDTRVEKVKAHLDELSVDRISSHKLKKEMQTQAEQVAPTTWSRSMCLPQRTN